MLWNIYFNVYKSFDSLSTPRDEVKNFLMGIRLHQDSVINLYSLNFILDVLFKDIQKIQS